MGLKCTDYFENSKYDSPDIQIITCRGCSSHLCLSDLILSDNFNGSSGPAYLVDFLINIIISPVTEDTQMKTGLYKINKIKCHQCLNNLGWFYKKSYSYSETYKEGKFVIEKSFIRFSDNLSTTQILKEKAMQSRYRRFSNSNSSSSSSTTTSNSNSNNNNNNNQYGSALTIGKEAAGDSLMVVDGEIIDGLNEDQEKNAALSTLSKMYKKTRRTSSSSSSSGSFGEAINGNLLNRLRFPNRNSETETFGNAANASIAATTAASTTAGVGVGTGTLESNQIIYEDTGNSNVFIDT
ncbi:hypothetical protein KGF56_001554 [Candida oxycetoniae]|uniref:Yippee domain-containing protein n=1 Tax=Candida oxycetoniae TaxID=497107 RepID=A0AAI9SZM6_9ASCO|nr:uncharacterized protein KGF56_001554 [Candida oxycetoniae]KAI3405536.1 hypothetical protein KGF56_001554 [Candida oxycetoniae]